MRLSFFDTGSPLPENWRELVTPSRQKRAERFLRNEDRLRCLGAGILLADELGVLSDDEVVYGSFGKPYLRDNRAQFNLSHSGSLVVLAVSDMPVGVDIERVGSLPLEKEELPQIFSPQEVEMFNAQTSTEDFYKLWTGKEALMKATGQGFSVKPSSFCVLPLKNGVHTFENRMWDMKWLHIEEYALCVAEETRLS